MTDDTVETSWSFDQANGDSLLQKEGHDANVMEGAYDPDTDYSGFWTILVMFGVGTLGIIAMLWERKII